MGARTKHEPGTPSWVDISTPDTKASSEFYAALFGWTAEDQGPEAGGYVMLSQGGRSVAGMGPQQHELAAAGAPAVWMTYVTTDDVAATAKKVEAAGGGVMMPPMQVMDAGHMGIFTDPTGAVFAAWQPLQHIGAELVNEPVSLSWNELVTSDPGAVKDFYTEVFGWAFEDFEGPMDYTEIKLDGRSVGGLMRKPPEMGPAPDHWATYFAVDDCDATVARVIELGGSVMVPPMDIPPGRNAVVVDPHGATFNVIALTEAAD